MNSTRHKRSPARSCIRPSIGVEERGLPSGAGAVSVIPRNAGSGYMGTYIRTKSLTNGEGVRKGLPTLPYF
jgi:hypothetical protein